MGCPRRLLRKEQTEEQTVRREPTAWEWQVSSGEGKAAWTPRVWGLWWERTLELNAVCCQHRQVTTEASGPPGCYTED